MVVSNTSPLNYLVLCEAVEVLPKLYGRIVIPHGVQLELSSHDAPLAVRNVINNPPAWLSVRPCLIPDTSLPLDSGEIEAICLAAEIRADALIIDDAEARKVGREPGFSSSAP
jgi:predicted nucleic acid-binding protein